MGWLDRQRDDLVEGNADGADEGVELDRRVGGERAVEDGTVDEPDFRAEGRALGRMPNAEC
jgi:hypothetical protein